MIYKRQPIQHKLPSNWQSTDAENNFNIVNFKGLQSYDNPLLAELESTYNCKNVYVDENGSLTVRPRLIKLGEYENIVKLFEAGSYYFTIQEIDDIIYLSAYDKINKLDEIVITNVNVTMQISKDNIPYFLITAENSLKLYKFIDNKFNIVTGDILLSNAEATDFSHYNILNSNTFYREYQTVMSAPFINELSGFKTVKSEISNNIDSAGIRISGSETDNFGVFFFKGLATTNGQNVYLSIVELASLKHTIKRFWYRAANFVPQCIVLNNYIQLFMEQVDAGNYNDYFELTRYSISMDGEIFRTDIVNVPKKFVIDDEQYTLYACTIVDENKLAFIAQPESGIDGKYGIFDIEALRVDFTVDISIEYAPNFIGNSAKKIFISHSGEIISYDKQTLTEIETFTEFESVTVNDDGIVVLNSDKNNITVFLDNGDNTSYDISVLGLMTADTASMIDFYTAGKNIYIKYQLSEAFYTAYISDNNIYVLKYNNRYDIYYAVRSGSIIWSIPNNTSNLVISQIKPGYVDILKIRNTEQIPILADISDKSITSFYLDGIYWFITEHHIFGTGSGSSGQLTIEYWDPRKYFKITESITGAMRVSDTSFWVFHNSGAYLIYKSDSLYYPDEDGVGIYLWQITNTAKSKGCDFENGIITLPVTSYVSTVTIDDICSVQMRENIQSDDRILVPITTRLQKLTADLLLEAQSVVLCNYKYLTLYCINTINSACALVYDNAQDNWWYWEFPVLKILQSLNSEDNVRLLCKLANKTVVLSFSEDDLQYSSGIVSTKIYADNVDELLQIDWFWTSAIQMFNTINYRKQLLYTTFLLHDNNNRLGNGIEEQEQNFSYNFDIYSKQHLSSKYSSADRKVTRAEHMTYRTNIGNFTYLQITLKNQNIDSDELSDMLEVMTKPKFTGISFKYRTLSGGLT